METSNTSRNKDIFEEMNFMDLLDDDIALQIRQSDMVLDDGPQGSSSTHAPIEEAKSLLNLPPTGSNESSDDSRSDGSIKESVLVNTSGVSMTEPWIPRKIKKIMERCKLKFTGSKEMVHCIVKEQEFRLANCAVAEVEEYLDVVNKLQRQLHRKLLQLYHLNEKRVSSVDEKMRKEISIIKKVKTGKCSKLCDGVIALAWLVLEIDVEQENLFTTVDFSDQSGAANLTLKLSDQEALPPSFHTPLLRPLTSDFKFGRIGCKLAIHLRNFIFRIKDVKAMWRLELCRELEQHEFVSLMNDPFDTFLSYLRYT